MAKSAEILHLDFHGNIIHPILLWDQEMAVLIDTGFPGQIEDLRVAMEKVEVSFDKLKVVILTPFENSIISGLRKTKFLRKIILFCRFSCCRHLLYKSLDITKRFPAA